MKYIFVTGGVISSLGKGLTAASLGTLLENRGLKVTLAKFDPYLNVDPGTMNPFQHGEVYVTDDGARQILISATTSGSPTPNSRVSTTSRAARSTRASFKRNAVVIISARPSRSFLTSPTRSRPASSTSARKAAQTS